jgi:hypothetical protein
MNNLIEWRKQYVLGNSRCDYRSCIDFSILLVIWLLNTKFLSPTYPWCHNYLNDLLAMPLLLTYAKGLYVFKNRPFPRTLPIILLVLCSIIWEGIFPLFYSRSTADWMDIVMYTLGTLLFLLWRTGNDNRFR